MPKIKMSKSRTLLICAVVALLMVVLSASGANKKLTDLTALIQSQWATNDVVAIVDVSANATKKTTIADFDERYFNVSSDLLDVAHGGTGLTSGTSGGVLAFSASGTIVSSGALLANQILIGGGTGAAPSYLPAGSQYQVLRMGASSPAYGSVNLDQSAAVTGVLPNANTTATAANTASAIVARDTAGNFNAGTVSAALSGNASTATALAANPTDCAADTYATTIAANGNLTCSTVTNAGLAGSIAASKLVGSDIATVGTITSGTWNGTAIGVSYGGTGLTAITAPAALVSNVSGAVSAASGATANKVLRTDGSTISFTALNVSTDTTGIANVANGGTGKSSLTANALLLGNGSNPMTFLSGTTSGDVATWNGTTWTSQAVSGAGGTSSWYIDANMDGGNPDLGTTAVSSYTEIVNGSLTLKPIAGSAAVGVMCSSANAATSPSTSDTTCAAGNEGLGINFDITTPGTGAYQVCVEFAQLLNIDADDGFRDYFKLVETATNSQTIVTNGSGRIGAGFQLASSGGTGAQVTIPNRHCAIFNWASTGIKGIRLMYQQTINNAPNSNIILGDASASHGDRNITWSVTKFGRY